MDFNYARRSPLFPIPGQRVNAPALLGTSPGQENQAAMPSWITKPDLSPNEDSVTSTIDENPNPPNLADLYSKVMNSPSGPSNTAYRNFLAQGQPQRENFQPDKMQRLGAILGGISEGAKGNGIGAYHGAQSILDDSYNEALGDYKTTADRLAEAARLEDAEKSTNNASYRNIIADQYNQGRLGIDAGKLANARTNTASLVNSRNARAITYETPEQKLARMLKLAEVNSQNSLQGKKNFFDYSEPVKQKDALTRIAASGNQSRETQATKFSNIKDLIDYKNANPAAKLVKTQGGNWIFVSADGTSLDTGIDTGTLSQEDAIKQGLAAKEELKQTPSPDKETTKKRNKDGSITTKTTSTGGKVKMTSPDGKTYQVDPSEVEEAKKHGWK